MLFQLLVSGRRLVFCPIVLIILTCWLLRNVRQVIRRRAAPGGNATHLSRIKRIDAQITEVLLLECFAALPSFLPYASELIQDSVTCKWDKSPFEVAWENIIFAMVRLFTYVFYGSRDRKSVV